ncbi:MAG: histidine kinase [Bacteroidota bacterium]
MIVLRDRRVILLLLALLCFRYRAEAQLEAWRHIGIEGMANGNVTALTEGPDGFMYFGTHEGVDVFDGRRFHHIEVPHRLELGINPFVNSLRWSAGGLLWVSTRSHIYTYNVNTGTVRVIYGGLAGQLPGTVEVDTVRRCLYILHARDVDVYRYTDTSLTFLRHKELQPQVETALINGKLYINQQPGHIVCLSDTTLETICKLPFIKDFEYLPRQQALILLTSGGLQLLDLTTKKLTTLRIPVPWSLTSAKTHITVLATGQVAIHYDDGFSILNKVTDTTLINFARDDKNPWRLHGTFVTVTETDHRGNLWCAEDGVGVAVLPRAPSVKYLPAAEIGSPRLWRAYHDTARRQVIVSSEKGLCAIRYNADKITYKNMIRPAGMSAFEVMDFLALSPGKVMVVTNGQGNWIVDLSTYRFEPYPSANAGFSAARFWGVKQKNSSECIFYGPVGAYLLNRDNGRASEIKKEGTAGNSEHYAALSVLIDKGQYWIGGGTGIDLLDSNFHLLKQYGNKSAPSLRGLNNSVVLDIKRAQDGNIYVATMGGGVFRLSKADTFCQVPLAGDAANIYCIERVDAVHLIITTSKGMCLYNTRTGKSRMLNKGNGMPVADFNQLALGIDPQFIIGAGADGVLLMNTADAVSYFYDTARLQVMQGARAVRTLTLQKGNHTLDADIAITGFTGNSAWKLEYMVDGVDDEWRQMAPGEWHIHYNSLKPGDYTLRVQAIDEQGVTYVQPVAIPITALPFFWQTSWFRLLLLVVSLGLLIIIVRFFSQAQLKWKLKKLEDEQKVIRERLRISRELHDNVGSQLTSLIAGLEGTGILLRKQQPELLQKKLDHLHSSARESMHQLRDSIWALNTEAVALSALLLRFETWLNGIMQSYPDISINITNNVTADSMLDPVKSLNLFRIMQESVHNVLKHAHATTVDITYTAGADALTIQVKDNGRGFDTAAANGHGTRFMRARAQEMAANLAVESAKDQGTNITLNLELK